MTTVPIFGVVIMGVLAILGLLWLAGLVLAASKQAWGLFVALLIVPLLGCGVLGFLMVFLFAAMAPMPAPAPVMAPKPAVVVSRRSTRVPAPVATPVPSPLAGVVPSASPVAVAASAEKAGLDVEETLELPGGAIRITATGSAEQFRSWLQAVESDPRAEVVSFEFPGEEAGDTPARGMLTVKPLPH